MRLVCTYRLMTVTVFPYARSPYGRILLYTPICSSDLTTASGVQGRMDLTKPAGGSSFTAAGASFVAGKEDASAFGSRKRILWRKWTSAGVQS